MRVFTVYKHETKGYEAVKVGWSWPGFFFGSWWMLVKGFLFSFIFYITAYGLTSIYYYDLDINAPYNANDFFVLIISLIFWLYPGFYGNSWLNKKYINKGYIGAKVIPATSKEAAIALAKNEEIQNPTYENIKPQDSIQESPEIMYESSYADAYKEIENYENEDNKKNKMQYIKNTSLWARAFAESDGDEVKQKVIYVKLRSEELDNDYDFEYKRKLTKKRDKNTIAFIIIVVFVFLLISQIQ